MVGEISTSIRNCFECFPISISQVFDYVYVNVFFDLIIVHEDPKEENKEDNDEDWEIIVLLFRCHFFLFLIEKKEV